MSFFVWLCVVLLINQIRYKFQPIDYNLVWIRFFVKNKKASYDEKNEKGEKNERYAFWLHIKKLVSFGKICYYLL